MNVNDVVYHGIRQQIRRVLTSMTLEQIDMGMTAFETGRSNWSSCFFARALPECDLVRAGNPTQLIADHLRLDSPVPVRIVWNLFDGGGKVNAASLTKQQLRDFITEVRDNSRPQEVQDLLRSLNTTATYTEEPVNACD